MIKDQWYVVLESKEVRNNKLLGVKRLGKNFVFYRDENDKVICFEDKCSHRGVKLSTGSVAKGCITCPFHGFVFEENGNCIKIPANGFDSKISKRFMLNKYETYELGDFIFLYNGKNPKNNPMFFKNLDENLLFKTSKVKWNTHYSRAVENQLDVIHLPFVHKKTIGKKQKTIVNGPKVKWDEEKMTIYIFNEMDRGQKPLKPNDINDIEKYFKLKFIMPNIWQNKISSKLKIVVAFVPIDDENTYIYLRTYQGFTRVPILKNIVLSVLNKYNKRVLKEDQNVVITQSPKNTHLNIKENLIQGDLPIGQYRNMVQTLVEEAQKNNIEVLENKDY